MSNGIPSTGGAPRPWSQEGACHQGGGGGRWTSHPSLLLFGWIANVDISYRLHLHLMLALHTLSCDGDRFTWRHGEYTWFPGSSREEYPQPTAGLLLLAMSGEEIEEHEATSIQHLKDLPLLRLAICIRTSTTA